MNDPREYEDDSPVDLAVWLEWPQCPICAQRRQARCPTCGYAAAAFPLADYQEPGAEPRFLTHGGGLHFADDERDESLLLMCPLCEEAFRPSFYRRCAACGYDYGAGVRLEPDDDFSPRVAWAMAGVVLVFLALVVYFWVILQR